MELICFLASVSLYLQYPFQRKETILFNPSKNFYFLWLLK
jgi:hypothetical protein